MFLASAVLSTVFMSLYGSSTYTTWVDNKEIHCQMCPHGHYKTGDCSMDYGPAQCEVCPQGEYQPNENTANKCEKCRTLCPYNTLQKTVQNITKNCSGMNDIVCECIAGMYDDDGACRNWTACGPGHGVKTKGESLLILIVSKSFLNNILDAVTVFNHDILIKYHTFCRCNPTLTK